MKEPRSRPQTANVLGNSCSYTAPFPRAGVVRCLGPPCIAAYICQMLAACQICTLGLLSVGFLDGIRWLPSSGDKCRAAIALGGKVKKHASRAREREFGVARVPRSCLRDRRESTPTKAGPWVTLFPRSSRREGFVPQSAEPQTQLQKGLEHTVSFEVCLWVWTAPRGKVFSHGL